MERTKIYVEREIIKKWEGVYMESLYSMEIMGENEKYNIYRYGGRNFGVWGGARFSKKAIIMVDKKIMEFPTVVDIRKVKKTWTDEDGRNRESIYFVVEPCNIIDKKLYLYELRKWRKTTLKGYGCDRNYSEHLEPLDEKKGEVMIEVVCETESWCNSGRYGNTYKLVVSDTPCRVVGEGVK
jgi:hypothetical protein